MSERTLAIIKPDAVKKHAIGDIIARYEKAGLKPVAIRMMQFSIATAEGFYAVHKARPFFDSLCTFMVSGPVVVLVLQGDNAIKKNRELMGAIRPRRRRARFVRPMGRISNLTPSMDRIRRRPLSSRFHISFRKWIWLDRDACLLAGC